MAGALLVAAGAGGYGVHRLKDWLNGESSKGGAKALAMSAITGNGGLQSSESPDAAEAAKKEAGWPTWKIVAGGVGVLSAFYIYAKFRPFR